MSEPSFKQLRFIILSIQLFLINGITLVYSQSLLSFSKNDYKAASQNWSVQCDASGYVYFANSSGLLQFDGVSWQLYSSPNGSIIRAVATDDEKIYSGGYREIGYWERSKDGELAYFSLTDSVQSQFETNEEFWNIFTNRNQTVFHSFAGIYIYENNRFTIIKTGGFFNFATQINNTIYVSIFEEGIYRLEGKQLVPFIKNKFLKDKYVRFIAHGKEPGTLYIGTESNGLYVYDSITQKFKVLIPELQSFFTNNKINHGKVTPTGDIIIGTILDGIKSFSPEGKIKFHYNKKNGLPSNTVLGISYDSFNNIWLALDAGIKVISSSQENSYELFEEKDMGAVYSGALFNGQLYLGTNQGLYYKNLKNQANSFKLIEGTQGQVWDCRIIDKTLFIGHNSGTHTDDGTNFTKLSSYSGAYNIKQHPHHPDVLVQGTYNDLMVYKRSSQGWKVSNIVNGFNNLVRFIEFDHLGNLWATHFYGGLYKIRLDDELRNVESIVHYDHINQEKYNRGHMRAFKVENQMVITSGHQLYTYDDLHDSIVPYPHLNKAVGKLQNATRIVAGPNHHYWFISTEGMGYFKIYGSEVEMINYYPANIFNNHLIPGHENVVSLNDSTAMVCLENGYALLHLKNSNQGEVIMKHQLTLRQIVVENRKGESFPIDITRSGIDLPHSLNNVYLRYSFPLFNEEIFKFQYKVDGLSDNWSDLTEQPIIQLTRIPAGEYTVHIKAVNNWLKSSQTHQMKLKIRSPWYQTAPAIACYLIMVIALMMGLKHITSRKIKLKEKRKREEKEKELIQLKNEKLSSELSYKSQKLASSAMSIIKKNEFLLSLKAKIKKHKEILGVRYPDKYYQDIIDKIDDNISGQDDWQIFEANFEQAHETFLKTMKSQYPNLTPSDLRLCAYLRINLTSKDIAPLLGITVRGVENHRYRLRKKLDLSADDNLIDFIINM